MSKFTFVAEYEDGKEPLVGAGTQILGGKLCSVAFFDYKDDFFTEKQCDAITEAISDMSSHGLISGDDASSILEKVRLLTT